MVVSAPVVNICSVCAHVMEIEWSKLILSNQPTQVNRVGARNVPGNRESSVNDDANDRLVVFKHENNLEKLDGTWSTTSNHK